VILYSGSEIFLNKLSEYFVHKLFLHYFFEAFIEHFPVSRESGVHGLVILHVMFLRLHNQSKFVREFLNIAEIESER
jgi:hypothetical protein